MRPISEITNIAVDIDDVMADLDQVLFPWHNEQYGTTLTREDHTTFNLAVLFQCSPKEAIRRLHEFYDSGILEYVPIIEGAYDGVEYLAEHHKLHVITSRYTWLTEVTIDWLDRNMPPVFNSYHFTNHLGNGNAPKAQVCQENGYHLLIDDSLGNVLPCPKHGIAALLYNQLWNQLPEGEQLPSGIIRVDGWREVKK